MTVGIVPIQRAYAATMDALRAVHHDAEPRLMEDLRQALLRQREAIEVNQRMLRHTLEDGDAYVQQLFATKRPA
jgi:hypothetical protein